ncbi:MAG: hypothetical protein ABJH85_01965 [Paracoccaceae bacterium]
MAPKEQDPKLEEALPSCWFPAETPLIANQIMTLHTMAFDPLNAHGSYNSVAFIGFWRDRPRLHRPWGAVGRLEVTLRSMGPERTLFQNRDREEIM